MGEDIINHSPEQGCVPPEEEAVRRKLEWFQDQKLALMLHWGPYSQLGIIESWPLSDGDASWSRKQVEWETDGEKFREQYFSLNRTFNPIRFDPEAWASFAQEMGARYLIFTTKHHDGFCMYDSRHSGYRITAPDCPFSAHPRADVAKALFDVFRKKGIGIAAYFSKPDWHCPWYWAKGCERPIAFDRNPTYDPKKRPDLWEAYTRFTHDQLMELVENYGPLDILRLDGGQVNPANGQDIRMAELAARARRVTPDLLIADRTVGGPYENYITPEQTVPDHVLHVPWESCVTVGEGWSYQYDDEYKSARTLIHMLIHVVTRGGNLALNLGPMPDGRLPEKGMRSLRGLGGWLKRYGEAIYGTRAVKLDTEDRRFGATEKDGKTFLLRTVDEGERLPETMILPWRRPVASVTAADSGESVPFAPDEGGIRVRLPKRLLSRDAEALVLRLE